MSRQACTRVTCAFCGMFVTVPSGDLFEVDRLIRKRHWIDQSLDSYGGTEDFCSVGCLNNWLNKMETDGITFDPSICRRL